MPKQKLKFQKLNPDAKIPTRGTDGAAGYDLYLAEPLEVDTYMVQSAKFGVAVEIPEGYCGLLVERSSSHKRGYHQVNKIGVIDSDYRGELRAPVVNMQENMKEGERVAQLVIIPCFNGTPEEVDSLSNTERGDGGFGSTGT